MKIFLYLSFFCAFFLFIAGFYFNGSDPETSAICFGLAICALFFLWMPAFIYHRWKNKNVNDYMLNKENILKMRKHVDEKQSRR